ncbi:Tryptophan 2-halogenase [Madurella fahalii]|uniref:Tryptophan 2-halogenase n=1 Tax=Madurella fahalii TaxID=1157608 RepID=A0ABQ0G4M7_9PEZI
MSIPDSCTVLVIGGGPGGSYTASALAREGVDTVLLEADTFPRYHIGESMLASIRYFLRFIDLESKFDNHGFVKKLGASFKLSDKREAFTNFIAVNGPNGYAWNVVRSEADLLMFQHASESGAHTFDGTKVESIEFEPASTSQGPGRPVAAKWSRKDGSSGTIKFDYLVDASGRAGIVSTKYLKNRKFNEGLKNVATWGYWKGAKAYAPGTEREGQPFFEALDDMSGWCWAIPLHNDSLSVGIVMRQDESAKRKKASTSPSAVEFYKECLSLSPIISDLLSSAELTSPVRAASDWSYSASSYAGPGLRIVGDAGCFIDPFFSSGLHLAIAAGLSAAMTIQAARRGDCDEAVAAEWHSSKVTEGYTRFLLVVMMALKQIRKGTEPVLSDFNEDGFDRAFGVFTPIIQGLADADVGGKLTQARVSDTVTFCLNAYNQITPLERKAVLDKLARVKADPSKETREDLEKLTEEELKILRTIRARQIIRTEDTLNIDHFTEDAIDGYAPRLRRGELGLARVEQRDGIPKYTESLLDVLKSA